MSSRQFALSLVAMFCTGSLLVSCGQGDGGGGEAGGDGIVLINRQNSSGTYKYFQEAVLDKEDFKSNTKDQSGSQAVVDLVGTMRFAIGYSGMGYKTDQVKFLKISQDGGQAFLPTVANAQSGSYPVTRPLQIYTKGQPEGAIAHYVQWILSEKGQTIVANEGYVPLPTKPITAAAPQGDHKFQVTGSDTMVQLAQTWAAAYNREYPNVSVQVSGGGSGVGISAMMQGTVDIANASRKMKDSERADANKVGVNPVEFVVGKDALAVYVHKDNPLGEISVADLKQIYADGGKISTWQQVSSYPTQ